MVYTTAPWRMVFAALTLALMLANVACNRSSGRLIPEPDLSAGWQQSDTLELSFAEAVQIIDASPPPPDVDQALWGQLTSELIRVLSGSDTDRMVAKAPAGALNQVNDLVLADDGGGGAVLEWTYLNTGDYDLNGEVNIADLTQVGIHFGATDGSPGWDTARHADGDGNGEVNFADVTPIGLNFFSQTAAYNINGSHLDFGPWSKIGEVLYPSAVPENPQQFSFPMVSVDYSTISVIPVDASGNEGIRSNILNVAPARLTSPLTISRDTGFSGTDEEVTFAVGLSESTGIPLAIELIEVDSMGSELSVLAAMYDDGDPTHGDEFADDGTYACRLVINRPGEGAYFFAARIEYDDGSGPNTIETNVVELRLFAELTNGRLDEILSQLDGFLAQVDDLLTSMGAADAALQMEELLQADSGVSAAGLLAADTGVWYDTADGIGCNIRFPDEGGAAASAAASSPGGYSGFAGGNAAAQPARVTSSFGKEVIGPSSRKVMILEPFQFLYRPQSFNPGHDLEKLFLDFNAQNELPCRQFQVYYPTLDNCTVKAFAELQDYGVVIIITRSYQRLVDHGNTMVPGQTGLLTSQRVNAGETNLTRQELLDFKMGLLNIGAVFESGEPDTWDKRIGVNQNYIKQKSGPLPMSLVYLAADHTANTDGPYPGLLQAFISSRAGVVYGFDDVLNSPDFAVSTCSDLLTALLAGKHTEEVFTDTPKQGSAQLQALYTYRPRRNLTFSLFPKRFHQIPVEIPAGADQIRFGAINNKGQIVGHYFGPETNQLAIWQINSDNTLSMTNLGINGRYIWPRAITDSGLIVGMESVQGESGYWYNHAISIAGPPYSVTVLDPAENHKPSAANDINEAGVITGFANFTYDPPYNSYNGIWSGVKATTNMNGTFKDLGILRGVHDDQSYEGVAINHRGDVAVTVRLLRPQRYATWALISRNGALSLLPLANNMEDTRPYDIDADIIVGTATYVAGSQFQKGDVPYLWNTTNLSKCFNLPGLVDFKGYALSLNKYHQIVGSSDSKAVIWERAWSEFVTEYDDRPHSDPDHFVIYNLNCLLGEQPQLELIEAHKINDHGQIIGQDSNSSGFVLVPFHIE